MVRTCPRSSWRYWFLSLATALAWSAHQAPSNNKPSIIRQYSIDNHAILETTRKKKVFLKKSTYLSSPTIRFHPYISNSFHSYISIPFQYLFSCNFLSEGFSAQFMIRDQCNFASCLLHRLTKSLIAVDCQGHATTCSETARKSLSLPLKTFKPDIIRILCFIFSFHSQNFRFIEFIELYCIELI